VCVPVRICTYTFIKIRDIYMNIHMHMHCKCMCICICMYTHAPTHTHTHTLPVGNTKFLLSFILSAGLAFRSCARPGYDSRTLFPRLRTFKHAQCFPQSAVHFSTFQLKLCGFFPLFFFLPSFVPLGKYVVMRTIEADVFISVQILIILSGGYDNKIN